MLKFPDDIWFKANKIGSRKYYIYVDLCYMKIWFTNILVFCKLCKNLPTSNRLSKCCKNVIVIKSKFFKNRFKGVQYVCLFFVTHRKYGVHLFYILWTKKEPQKIFWLNWIFFFVILSSILHIGNCIFSKLMASTHNTTFPLQHCVMTVYIFHKEAEFFFLFLSSSSFSVTSWNLCKRRRHRILDSNLKENTFSVFCRFKFC